jgi:hypothetical protein
MEVKLEIVNPLTPVWHGHLDHYVTYDRKLPYGIHCGFELLWYFRCLGTDTQQADRLYESTRLRGFDEEHLGIMARFESRYGKVDLPDLNTLRAWNEPWLITISGILTRASGLAYQGDTVVMISA